MLKLGRSVFKSDPLKVQTLVATVPLFSRKSLFESLKSEGGLIPSSVGIAIKKGPLPADVAKGVPQAR
jgi:hypothetical protein